MERVSSRMVELLHETAHSERSRNWRPHLAQIVSAVHGFGDRCRRASQEFGSWQPDGLQADEVVADVREQGQRLVNWLQRMMPE